MLWLTSLLLRAREGLFLLREQYDSQLKTLWERFMLDNLKTGAGKLPMELIPRSTLEGLARSFDEGAHKYGAYNWRAGISYSTYYGALLRHLVAFWDGEDIDEESGNHHLDHALACLSILHNYSTTPGYEQWDDRWKSSPKEHDHAV